MTSKRFIFEQHGNFHTVVDTVENKPMGVFEFKENEFPVYACFHKIIDKMNDLHEENEHYKSIFLELVETALTDKNCRELYCKGILDIFDKANSLNQAREMIKGHLK